MWWIHTYPPFISISYPSSLRRFRSGLRFISWCCIEDHIIGYKNNIAFSHFTLGILLRAIIIVHGVSFYAAVTRIMFFGKINHLVIRNSFFLPGLFAAVNINDHLKWLFL